MLSRRAFAALTSLAPAALGRAASAPAFPALPALQSRKSEARPIPAAERSGRLDRARQLMQEHRIDAICLTGGSTLRYFTGVHWGNSERLFACVLPRQGKPFYVSPAFEEDRVREQLSGAPDGPGSRIYVWQEDQDPYNLLARGLRELGVASGRLGMEEHVDFVFSDGIARAASGVEVVSATAVTAGCRARKSAAELALLRLANQVTLQAYEAAWNSLKEGMTTSDFSALIGSAYDALGFPGYASVQAGEFSALPHGSARPQRIREGTVIMIDDGCSVEGYQSDVTRCLVLGKPSRKMKDVFEVVRQSQSAALAAARPGVPCGSVDAAARRVITDAGFGPDYAHFTHRVGHGIGLDGHEWPYLVRGNTQPLEPGMTFSDEPGVYLRGQFGIRLEDCMYITEKGAEFFTAPCESLEQPFGRR